MNRKREIIIKIIKDTNVNNRRLAKFFAQKFIEMESNIQKEKS